MSKCQNPKCDTGDYCTRMIMYGDIVLCHWCYGKLPHRKKSLAVSTGKNQGIEELLEVSKP